MKNRLSTEYTKLVSGWNTKQKENLLLFQSFMSPNLPIFVDLKKTRILLTFAEIVNLHNKSFLKDIYDWVLSLVDITWITQILFLSFCAKKIENVQNERELQIDGILQRCSIIIWLYGCLFIFIPGRCQITSFFKV